MKLINVPVKKTVKMPKWVEDEIEIIMIKPKRLILIISVIFLSTSFFGCALKAQHANIASERAPDVMVCPNAVQKTIGVALVSDKRPPVEKVGDKPHGIFLLLWNQRIGDYVSSDKNFLDPVDKSMTEQIGRFLSRTNCFYNIKILETEIPDHPSPEKLLVALAKEKVDYVLVSEVKHFYGKQHQKAYFYMLPAYFVDFYGWGNQAGDAEGHTEIVSRLYETNTGQEVWSDRLLGDGNTVEKGSFPSAARESFHQATTQLANGIYRFAQILQGSITIPKPENK